MILPRGPDCPTSSREGYVSTPVPGKMSPHGTAQQSTCASKTTIYTKKSHTSSVARRKQLELEAAEAKARIQMELIDKKLQAELAKADHESEIAHNVGTAVAPDEDAAGSHRSSLPSEKNVHENVEKWLDTNCASPVQHDTSIQQLAHTLKDLITQSSVSKHEDRLLSRLATPRELPIFSGDGIEWLHFKSAYDDSSRVCKFSDSENLWRLRKSLRGEAKEAVTDLLIGNTPPSAVMEALELRFGRADIIISNITMQLKKLPSLPINYQQDLINLSVKVNNCVATIRALDQNDYLRSPELATAIISKLPSTLIGRWTEFAYNRLSEGKSRLELLAKFLKLEAEMLSIVGCTQPRDKKPMDAPTKRTEDKYRHRTVYTSSVVAADNTICRFCHKGSHTLPECRMFKRAMRRDRWRFVKTRGLCYCCLLARHNKDTCPAPMCDVDNCGMAHHRLLHWTKPEMTSSSSDKMTVTPEPAVPVAAPDASMMHFARDGDDASIAPDEFALLKVIAVQLRGPKGVVNTYALLDDGAEVSVIDAELADTLGLECVSARPIRFTDAFGLSVYQSEVPSVKVEITGQDNVSYDCKLRKCAQLKLCSQNLSVLNGVNSTHLSHIKHMICTDTSVKPRLLIGEDNYFLIAPLEVIHGDRDSLYASRSRLGWTIHGFHRGRTHSSKPRVSEQNVFHLAHSRDTDVQEISELNDLIKNSFNFDLIGISPVSRENTDHIRAVEILDKTARQVGNQWEVGLPFKKDVFMMPDSFNNAYSRQQLLLRKFRKNNDYADRYKKEISKLLDNGYARELTDNELSADHVWYLPHFGVQNPNKPGKLRLVFDAAAKVDGVCLNDYLLTGPDLYNSLYGIMLRFRENKIVIIGDIRDMFLRILIRPSDQHVLRFLWQESSDSPTQVCSMQSLIFGATCSPFVAQYIKNKNALKYKDLNPEAVDVIINNHYMDDCCHSTCDENTAIKLVHDITSIHASGGFEIRGWSSNSKPVLDSIPAEALAQSAVQFKHGAMNTSERTLGLIWHPADDSFGFQISLAKIPSDILDGSTPPTKAKMLSIIMSVYDIHGFLSPFVIKSKIIFQDVHRSKVDWKCRIHSSEHTKWMLWLDELKLLKSLRIPRWYHNADSWTQCYPVSIGIDSSAESIVDRQLHIFCDASIKAYAAVVYWRFTRIDGNVLICFAASKSRVTPLRPVSVPRLELQGALTASRLADSLQREHKNMKRDKRYFWTDSQTVLQWIRSDPRSYKPYVAHRLGEIDELTSVSEWRYVPTRMNVADLATKDETPPLTYDSVWFRGPQFLRQPEDTWPKDCVPNKKPLPEVVCEERSLNMMVTKAIEYSLPNENNYSSWLRLVRVTARILMFVRRCRRIESSLNVELMNEAELLLLQKSQHDSFEQDIELVKQNKPLLSTSRLLTLTPYLDNINVLRVAGRIDKVEGVSHSATRPAILDGRHQIARLIVEYYHRKAMHGANELVVNELRQRYWILKLRPTVRAVAARCPFCRHRRAAPQPQRMADLPAARLHHNRRPFTYTGVDFFGPMEVTVGRKRLKRYGVMFTCLTVRAIHLEISESLSTDSTIMALRRMIARRGTPSVIYSDNGTNLRGADNELKRSLLELDESKLREDGTVKGIEWRFIPPGAPEKGGAWERMIRTVKTALKAVLKERAPHPETLFTLFAEVEALVNSRPITHVSCDPNYPEALTPNHFLLGTSSNGPVLGRYDNDDLCLRKQWRIAQRLTDMFWARWVKEYLPTLLPRQKWLRDQRALRDGDYVLIVEPNLERGCWRHGVVSATHAADDGRVRVVDIRTRTGLVRRPVTRVALLEPSEC